MAPHSKARSRRGRLLLEVPLALVFAALGVYLSLRHSIGDGGILLLKDHEVLVRVDNLSGELQADDRPGAHTSLPWLEALHRLDRRPLRYVMGTGGGEVDRTAPNLVVRGRDGANYGFGQVELQVALDPALADVALADNGGDREMILRLVDAYARPTLRDAFGRYTPREIVLPEVKQAGTAAALEDLQGALARHGVRVLELSVSKPIFEPKYQEVIHRRKVAEQDTERLAREEQELVATADAMEAHFVVGDQHGHDECIANDRHQPNLRATSNRSCRKHREQWRTAGHRQQLGAMFWPADATATVAMEAPVQHTGDGCNDARERHAPKRGRPRCRCKARQLPRVGRHQQQDRHGQRRQQNREQTEHAGTLLCKAKFVKHGDRIAHDATNAASRAQPS